MRKMDKKIMLGLIVILLISGCGVYHQSSTMYFKDTGNKIENHKICEQLSIEHCKQINCVGYRLTGEVCDKGECYC